MSRIMTGRSALRLLAIAVLIVGVSAAPDAQRGGRGGGPPPRQAAPIDMTGYWVSIVTEDWRFRMLTPAKGDYESLPLTAEGRRVADMWDPERDPATDEECRWYGAASIMSVPGRLHITWEDERTLRLDTDAGTQTRRFRFDRPGAPSEGAAWNDGAPAGDRAGVRAGAPGGDASTWQGSSTAAWRASQGGIEPASLPGGSLEVHTTQLRPGYLRRNGVPYSADADLTEFYYVLEDDGVTWLILITVVKDPQYLTEPFVTSRQFMKEPDGSKWNPTLCTA
jgi:hypothetical protein